jgi:hypothetical protein
MMVDRGPIIRRLKCAGKIDLVVFLLADYSELHAQPCVGPIGLKIWLQGAGGAGRIEELVGRIPDLH